MYIKVHRTYKPAPSLLKRAAIVLLGTLTVALLAILICSLVISRAAKPFTYFTIESVPSTNAGLVLGTSRQIVGGGENKYFTYRMQAAAQLFKIGKVKYLILSGNNDSPYYNEPTDMQRALLELGVPRSAMKLDYGGFRTFDSVVRCKVVFGETNITIISQNFHTARAVYIARSEGLDAVAFAAQDVRNSLSYFSLIREYLARPKAVWDVNMVPPHLNITTNDEWRAK